MSEQWQWVEVPVWRYLVKRGTPPDIDKTLILRPTTISPVQAAEGMALYEQARATKEYNDNYEDVIGRVLAVALAGYPRGREALEHMGDAIDLDGHAAEVWREAFSLYQLYSRETEEINPIPAHN